MNTREHRPRPNILLILADDHGVGDASIYQGPNVQTPNIDRIAGEGMLFSQFYANSPVCSPSRASLMTGRYPDMVGVPGVIRTKPEDSWGYFDPRAITLPLMLGESGYHTCHIGKWHLGLEDENHPRRRGFHRFQGFLGDMMDDYFSHIRDGQNYLRDDFNEVDPQGHATDVFTDWAVSYLRGRADQRDPFFCYLAYNAPHTPIQPPPGWAEKIKAREPEIDDKRALYLGLVEHLDEGIGRVLDALDETGLAENTVVIYTSDNGGWLDAGASNLSLRGGKLDMYEGGIRVPCCVRWPERIKPGSVSNQMAMLMDLFPTCCEIAGVTVEHEIEGRSILPLLQGGELDSDDRWYYWVRREGWGRWCPDYVGNDYHAIRHGSLKLTHNHAFAPLEMFDLDADPSEKSGLDAVNHPESVEMRVRMQERIRLAGAIPWRKRG